MNSYPHLDPITFSVLDEGIRSAVEEMKSVVERTAYSNLWREAGDLSCGLLLENGEIVAQGRGDIPIHLASMSLTLKGMLAAIPLDTIHPGDVLLQNDPYQGNNHMPDFFMAMPVFHGSKLVCFTAVRGHYVDIGSPVAGSYNLAARDIYGEGLRIPPVKLYKEGTLDREIAAIIAHNVRNESERMGDMRSQYAGCAHAARRILDFCDAYGEETVVSAMLRMLDHSEATARAALANIPHGVYEFTDYCDGDGVDSNPFAIHCKLTAKENGITVDFTGSAPQRKGPMNSPLGVTYSAVCFAVKAVTEPHTPSNSGSYRPITVIAPKGSVVNPCAPAPVVAGNHETSSRIADVVLGCLAKALPDAVPAAGTGSSTVLILGRCDVADDALMYEVHGAGQGGTPTHDGSDARRTSIGNTGNTPNEILEITNPVRMLEYAIRTDTGGIGQYRGGNGIVRRMLVTEDATITLAAERDASHPYGLQGGHEGACALFEMESPDGEVVRLKSKVASMLVPAQSTLTVACAGGGGYGLPGKRDLAAIQNDLDNGYVTPAAAESSFNVTVEHVPERTEGAWLARAAG